jgi:hypothetical protein
MLMPAFGPFPLPDRIDSGPNGINQGLEPISMFPCSPWQFFARSLPVFPFLSIYSEGYVFTIGNAAHTL